MKKCGWLAGSLAICFSSSVEAAVMPQSETGKEVAIAISKTHGIWGGFIDYAVLAALVLALLALLWTLYVHHVIGQRLQRLEKAFAQKKDQETTQPNMAIHVQSFDGSRDIDVMKKDIRDLKDNIDSLEEKVNSEARDKQNVNIGIETTNTNEPLYADKKYTSLGEVAYDETKADDFIREYNALYDMRDSMDKKRKQMALENDSRLRRFSCSNDNKRLYNPDIAPIFESRSNGMYMAYDLGNNYYAVLPAYATYENSKHVTYAMKEVFDSNYEGEAYTKIQVVKPAIFVVSDDKWTLTRKGNLVLKK